MKSLMEQARRLARRLGGRQGPTLVPFRGAGLTLYLRDAQGTLLRDAEGCLLRARSGTVWITQEGDSRDIVLRAGESFLLDRAGPAMISPLSDAAVDLVGCGPDAGARPQPATATGEQWRPARSEPRLAPIPA